MREPKERLIVDLPIGMKKKTESFAKERGMFIREVVIDALHLYFYDQEKQAEETENDNIFKGESNE